MKKFKILFLIPFTVLLSFTAKTQDTIENYYTIKARWDAYFDSLSIVREGNLKGTGFTQYKRWVKYFDPIMFPHGDFNIYNQALQNYCDDFNNKRNEKLTGYEINWSSIGPNKKPSGSSWGGTGQIHYIYFDPTDNTYQKMFACSPVGGLFRSTDGGNNWFNCGTDQGIPLCGVSSVAVDIANSNTNWFITTGNGEGYTKGVDQNFHESIGIYRTTDAGNSWTCIGFSNTTGFGTRIKKIISVGSGTNLHLFAVIDDGPSNSDGGLVECSNPYSATPTWTTRIQGDFYDLALKPNDNTILYVAGSYESSGHLYIYDIDNDVYTQVQDPSFIPPFSNTNYRRVSIQVTPANPDYVFAIFFTGDNNAKLCICDVSNNNTWVNKDSLPVQINEETCNANGGRGKGWSVFPVLRSESKYKVVFCNTDKVYFADILYNNDP